MKGLMGLVRVQYSYSTRTSSYKDYVQRCYALYALYSSTEKYIKL